MRRRVLLMLGIILLLIAVASLLERPNSTSGHAPGQPSPHAIDQ